MQLQRPRIMGRRGDGEAAAPSARQQDIDVLAGLENKVFGNGPPVLKPPSSTNKASTHKTTAPSSGHKTDRSLIGSAFLLRVCFFFLAMFVYYIILAYVVLWVTEFF